MRAEKSIEDMCEEGTRWLGKMLQGTVRDTDRAGSQADLETRDAFVNLVRGG